MLLIVVLAAQLHALPDLRAAVARGDHAGIASAKGRWEQGWENEWQLVDAKFEDIDHWRPGIVLKWRGLFGNEVRTRTEAFTLAGEFYWAAESVTKQNREIARGGVEITPGGIRRYRNFALLGPKRVERAPSWIDHEVVGYELQVFTGGRVTTIYRAKLNFATDGRGDITLPPDAKVVIGVPVPELEVRRRHH